MPQSTLLIQNLLKTTKLTGTRVTSVAYSTGYQNNDWSSDKYQFLHKSINPTMKFQKSLMRLKVPKLEDSLRRYLAAQKVLLSASRYGEVETVVAGFAAGEGPALQQELVAKDMANPHTSYITSDWFDMYLQDRSPVVLTHTPFMMFQPDPILDDQLLRATAVTVSTARVMRTLRSGLLEPEVYHMNSAKSDTQFFRKVIQWSPEFMASYSAMAFKAFPLDMSQFPNLLCSTRLPHLNKDSLLANPSSKHTLVVRNGHFYVFDVLDESGNILPPSTMLANLQKIMQDPTSPSPHPLGLLTAANRDVWAKARLSLEAAGNGASLAALDGAMFALVLDDTEMGGDRDLAYRTLLHGDAANRWFDKSFSVVVTKDAQMGLNFEHSWGDGVAVMRYVNEVSTDMAAHADIIAATRADDTAAVTKLPWNIPEDVRRTIEEQRKSFAERTAALGVNILESDVIGKRLCKDKKVSPDAAMQLGLQLAHRLSRGHDVATYESCSTSAFRQGRTETIRPATAETAAFCDAVEAGRSGAALRPLLDACSAKHNQLTKEAAMGDGFDRHLFALRKLCEARGDELPDLFTCPSYRSLNHNILSTSTLASPHIAFGGFGPVVRDGFGIGYSIQPERLGLVVSSFPPHADGDDLVRCAANAYATIRDAMC